MKAYACSLRIIVTAWTRELMYKLEPGRLHAQSMCVGRIGQAAVKQHHTGPLVSARHLVRPASPCHCVTALMVRCTHRCHGTCMRCGLRCVQDRVKNILLCLSGICNRKNETGSAIRVLSELEREADYFGDNPRPDKMYLLHVALFLEAGMAGGTLKEVGHPPLLLL